MKSPQEKAPEIPAAPIAALPESPPELITLRPDPADAPAAIAQREQADEKRAAALQAVPFVWLGKQLAPFTPPREAAFHQHRAALNAPPFGDMLESSQSFAADAARMLWFLFHEPDEWLTILAQSPRRKSVTTESGEDWIAVNAHIALELRIQEWMAAAWLGTEGEINKAYLLCIEILTRARATRAIPADPPDPDDSKN